MALVEFVNNSAPYLNAENLNNNFEYLENKMDNNEVYSTNEIKTNEVWIDGKPIYRKVITISNIGTSFDTTISDVDNLFFNDKSRISWDFSSISYPIDRARFSFTKQTNRITADNEDVATWNAVLVLEYTKTTD